MRGTRKLKSLHAMLAVSLSEGAYSLMLCRPPTRRWLSASLSEATYSLTMWPAARIFFPHYPILIIVMGVWGLFCTRMKGMWNLSIPHALLKIAHPCGACSLILSFHGGMGAFLHPIDGNVEPVDSVRC